MFGFSSTWFMEGFLHPLQTPSHLIVLLGLGVLLGQQGKTHLVKNWLAFIVAIMIGFVLNRFFTLTYNYELILLGLTLVIGLLLVIRRDYPVMIMLALTVVTSMTIGLDSSPVMIPGMGTTTVFNWLSGAAISIYLTVSGVLLLSLLFRDLWQGIVLRVLGSWIATSAIIVLTFSFAK